MIPKYHCHYKVLIGKLRAALEKSKKEVKASGDKYEEIVAWAKTAEETQKKHDDELKKGMVQQHEKFNVEYDFLNKENTALKDEIRNMKHELADHKSLLKQSLATIKNLHRDNDEKVNLADKAAKRCIQLTEKVERHELVLQDTVKKLELTRERDLRIQKQADENIMLQLKKKLDQKEGMHKEFEEKLAFLRSKVKDMEEEHLIKSRKIATLEEQVVFEARMREMNMQKRYEQENGGVDAILKLLHINEENAAHIDRLNENTNVNIEKLRQDIAAGVEKQILDAELATTKKFGNMVSVECQSDIEEEKEEKEEKEPAATTRPIDMNAVNGLMNAAKSMHEEVSESDEAKTTIKDNIFSDGFGNTLDDPFHAELHKPNPAELAERQAQRQSIRAGQIKQEALLQSQLDVQRQHQIEQRQIEIAAANGSSTGNIGGADKATGQRMSALEKFAIAQAETEATQKPKTQQSEENANTAERLATGSAGGGASPAEEAAKEFSKKKSSKKDKRRGSKKGGSKEEDGSRGRSPFSGKEQKMARRKSSKSRSVSPSTTTIAEETEEDSD